MEFEYTLEKKEEVHVFSIKGNLIEKGQAQSLLDEISMLIENGYPNFILSLHDFMYMNSTGLSVFINILTKARKADGEVILCCVPDKIKQLLLITKLNTVFTISVSVDEALNQFSKA